MKRLSLILFLGIIFYLGFTFNKAKVLHYYYTQFKSANHVELSISGMFSDVSAQKIEDAIYSLDEVYYVDVNFPKRKGICYVKGKQIGFYELKKAVDDLGYMVIDPDAPQETLKVQNFKVSY